jgi:hypothetical protein
MTYNFVSLMMERYFLKHYVSFVGEVVHEILKTLFC